MSHSWPIPIRTFDYKFVLILLFIIRATYPHHILFGIIIPIIFDEQFICNFALTILLRMQFSILLLFPLC
jgi:hypothetical protein